MNVNIAPHETVFRFEAFRLDRRRGLSRRCDGGRWEPVILGSRAIGVLGTLVEGRGELLTKQALMDAAWPGMTVEDNNLTVQISTLRRILDEGRAEGSCIQTVIGRGYRFVPDVTTAPETPLPAPIPAPLETAAPPSRTPELAVTPAASAIRPRRRSLVLTSLAAALMMGGLILGAVFRWDLLGLNRPTQVAPRLSMVVLPFQNLSGDPADDYLADGLTDDLTTDLSHVPEAFVIANASARTYKGRAVDARQIGRELGVRYVIEGSMRRTGPTLRVNVQLIATETGEHVWSDRLDEPIADLAGGQDGMLARMRNSLGINLVQIEVARARRLPPSSPDAFDLILRARALRNQPVNRQRYDEALSLYEQALRLDPSSVLAMTGAAAILLDERASRDDWPTFEMRKRTEGLVTRAREIAPASEEVAGVYAFWLFVEASCQQSMVAAREMIERYSNPTFGYGLLAWCLTATGHAEEEIPLLERAIRLNPRGPYLVQRVRRIGTAHLFLGHHEEAIKWLERALAVNPEAPEEVLSGTNRRLASAYALAGKDQEARRALAAADRGWPFDTVRGHWPDDFNPIFAAQVRHFQEGLRRAGERDHAEEDADFGVPVDADLHSESAGYTPITAPGAVTVRTADLPRLIAEQKPIVIDTVGNFWGRSIPGAIGLREAGVGGTVTDGGQDRLRRKMAALTGGDLSKPIVAVGWNSERFDGRNLTLRLVALGHTNVYWYRGGREAWEVAGQPETELVRQAW